MQGDSDVRERIARGDTEIPVEVKEMKIFTFLEVSERQRQSILSGGALNYVKQSFRILNQP
jgi:hypothetical protein